MNLARRILEGIHEVELEVTPEFRKPEGKLSVYHMHDLLKSLGWEQEVTDAAVTTEGGDIMVQRTWTHPDMSGVWIVALRHTDKTRNVTAADPNVAEVYSWGADWGKQEIVPNLKDVEDTAKFLAASHGLVELGTMGKPASEQSKR